MFKLPDLNHEYDALEPFISKRTVDVHYNFHHQGYVNKLNELLKKIDREDINDIIFLIQNIDIIPIEYRDDILYNASAVHNHNLYWNSMNPMNRKPTGKLKEQIEEQYDSYENFRNEFIRVAKTLVGSGYTFLVIDKEGKLIIMNTSNQDSPYSYGFTPLLTLDLWEHSYYLDYLNKRNDYIEQFFSVVDFDSASKIYEKNK